MRFRVLPAFLIAVLVLFAQASQAEDEVVLVVAKDSTLGVMPTLVLRKVYMGMKVQVDGIDLKGHMRRDDGRLEDIFLQSVLAMSRRSFERRALLSAIKYGAPRPESVNGASALAETLLASPGSVGYMWREEAEADSRVRIVQVLWREN